jgi:hypothetical protein
MKRIAYLILALALTGMYSANAQNAVTQPVKQKKQEVQGKQESQDKVSPGKNTGSMKKAETPKTGQVKEQNATTAVQPSDKKSGQVISKSGQEGAVKKSEVSLEYMKKEVYPVMKAERTKLDKAMSSEDREKLNQLREEYKKERGTTELFTESDLNMTAETLAKSNTPRMSDIRRQVLAIGNNYPKEMKESTAVLNGKKDEWKTGLAEASGNTMKSSTPSQIHGKPGAALDRNPIDIVTNPFLFLLWDAELPAAAKKGKR